MVKCPSASKGKSARWSAGPPFLQQVPHFLHVLDVINMLFFDIMGIAFLLKT